MKGNFFSSGDASSYVSLLLGQIPTIYNLDRYNGLPTTNSIGTYSDIQQAHLTANNKNDE